ISTASTDLPTGQARKRSHSSMGCARACWATARCKAGLRRPVFQRRMRRKMGMEARSEAGCSVELNGTDTVLNLPGDSMDIWLHSICRLLQPVKLIVAENESVRTAD